jgi:hypothetical protein
MKFGASFQTTNIRAGNSSVNNWTGFGRGFFYWVAGAIKPLWSQIILTRSCGPSSFPSDVCARYAWAFMKHVAGVPHSEGTRITVVAFSRVHAAMSAVTLIEQTRISAVSIVSVPHHLRCQKAFSYLSSSHFHCDASQSAQRSPSDAGQWLASEGLVRCGENRRAVSSEGRDNEPQLSSPGP